MWMGFWINAVSGVILLAQDATTKLSNPVFYVKMACVAAGVSVMIVMRRRVFRAPVLEGEPVSALGRRLAWLSLVCWAGAITAGRLMAYLGTDSGAPQFLNRIGG